MLCKNKNSSFHQRKNAVYETSQRSYGDSGKGKNDVVEGRNGDKSKRVFQNL